MEFKISNYSPNKYSVNNSSFVDIFVEFTTSLNKSTIGKSFGLYKCLEDRIEKQKIDISIDDRKVFIGHGQLDNDCRYVLKINNEHLLDIQGKKLIAPFQLIFNTKLENEDSHVDILCPVDNSVIDEFNSIELSDVGANKYLVQISREKTFEVCVLEQIEDTNVITPNKKLQDGVYFIRAKSMNGDFNTISSFAIRSYSNTPVSDEDIDVDYFDYGEVEDEEIHIESSVPEKTFNISRKNKLFVNVYNQKIPHECISPGILSGELSDRYDDDILQAHGEVNQRTFIVDDNDKTYVVKEIL